MSNKYQYEELLAAAIKPNATQEEINALGEWFALYGMESWNGEYYDADGYKVFPVIEWNEDIGQGTVSGYEIQ